MAAGPLSDCRGERQRGRYSSTRPRWRSVSMGDSPVSVSPSPMAGQFPVRVGPSASILACPKEVLPTASLQQMTASVAMGLLEQEKPALGQAWPGVCSFCSSIRFSLFTDGGTRAWRGREPCSRDRTRIWAQMFWALRAALHYLSSIYLSSTMTLPTCSYCSSVTLASF